MVMFLLSFVKGVQIRGGESISASGFGPGGPILGGSKSAGTPALYGCDAPRSIVFEIVSRTARLMVKYLKTYRILIFQLFTATFPA